MRAPTLPAYRLVLPPGWMKLTKGSGSMPGQLSRAGAALGGGNDLFRAEAEGALSSMVAGLHGDGTDIYLPTLPVKGVRLTLLISIDLIPVPEFEVPVALLESTEDAGAAEDFPSDVGHVGGNGSTVAPDSSEPTLVRVDAGVMMPALLRSLAASATDSTIRELSDGVAVRTVEERISLPVDLPAMIDTGSGLAAGEGPIPTERIFVRYYCEPPGLTDSIVVVTGTVTRIEGAADFADAEVELFDAILTSFSWELTVPLLMELDANAWYPMPLPDAADSADEVKEWAWTTAEQIYASNGVGRGEIGPALEPILIDLAASSSPLRDQEVDGGQTIVRFLLWGNVLLSPAVVQFTVFDHTGPLSIRSVFDSELEAADDGVIVLGTDVQNLELGSLGECTRMVRTTTGVLTDEFRSRNRSEVSTDAVTVEVHYLLGSADEVVIVSTVIAGFDELAVHVSEIEQALASMEWSDDALEDGGPSSSGPGSESLNGSVAR